MSDRERYGQRDLTYSRWHRIDSIQRYITHKEAWHLGMIDIDDCEYCRHCYEPLALIELAQDVGQEYKPSMVTAKLAERANVPAFQVFYSKTKAGDISEFRLTSLSNTDYADAVLGPCEFAQFLVSFHEKHSCPKRSTANGKSPSA